MLSFFWMIFLMLLTINATAGETTLRWYRVFGGDYEKLFKNPKEGMCDSSLTYIGRDDVRRCVVSGKTFDPCFLDSQHKRALCAASPWSSDVQSISIKNTPVNISSESFDMTKTLPWGMELSDGSHCVLIPEQHLAGFSLNYSCDNNAYLLNVIKRCRTEWKIGRYLKNGSVDEVAVTTAWF